MQYFNVRSNNYSWLAAIHPHRNHRIDKEKRAEFVGATKRPLLPAKLAGDNKFPKFAPYLSSYVGDIRKAAAIYTKKFVKCRLIEKDQPKINLTA